MTTISPYARKGTPRSTWAVVVLTLLTCGIYAFFWTYATHQELKEYTGTGLGGPIGLLVFFLAGVVTPFLLAAEVHNASVARGLPSRVSGKTGLWILLPLVGWFVWHVKVQDELNALWAAP